MPAVSKSQKTLFCISLSIKEGKTPASFSKKAADIAKNNSLETIKEFCESPVAS
ncbi:hypothetical protein LCGC14_0907440 [marine sediment metagenome]|uniref:Uncharacterized protein n=1 Tax=marine sediment metagenome TaxID=412755 RepID=A0A0F9RDI7_9ZZZZ